MFNDTPFYHGTIRSVITQFGKLFSNIRIARYNNDGEVEQIIHVPIQYANREKWIQQIENNPGDTTGVYTTLPRLAFETTGYSYDASRKLARMNTISCPTEDGKARVFTPVPYDLSLSLQFATKNQGDALQILEQILPIFTPDYTVTIKALTDLNITQDVPFILGGVTVQDDYEGDMTTRRFVIHTLTFTAKINLFGDVTPKGVIKQVEANVKDNPSSTFIATQETLADPIIENWMDNF